MNLKININTFLVNIFLKKKHKLKFFNKILNFSQKTTLNYYKYYFFSKFIINLTQKKSSTFIHIMNCYGNEKYFNSAKKFKNNNKIEQFYKLLLTKFKFLIKKPISIHFNSINLNFKWFLKKVAKKFFIINIKFFNKYSHNGCKIKK